jgi:Gnt-I system high-affinity gluconate transporter
MPLIIVGIGVALLLLLMIWFKLNGFLSLIIVSLIVGVLEGMPIDKVVVSIKNGVGGTLGSMALIIGFGAILGKLMADSGGAQRIATTLIAKFGKKKIQLAVLITGFVVGFALFYEIGFVLLIPLVFTIAAEADIPLLYIGVPMAAALSVTHGFLPPHPGPTAIAGVYNANISKTLLYGAILGIPTVIIAGPVFAKFLKKMEHPIPTGLYNPKIFKEEEMPSFGISVFTALIPVFFMAVQAIAEITLPSDSLVVKVATFFGDPVIALLIAVVVAIFTFGLNRKKKMDEIMKTVSDAINTVSMIILIIGGGGALKQVLVDSGVANYIAAVMKGSSISPLILVWLIAALLRIALGSATVAAMTAAGIVAPLISATGVSPELMVLATGAGSLIFSHVNDPGFWIFKEYFNLSIPETLKSWSIMETLISVCGLLGVLVLNVLI